MDDLVPIDAAPGELAIFEKAMRALEAATTPGEVKHLRDVGEGLRQLAERAHLGWECQQWWAGYRLRC